MTPDEFEAFMGGSRLPVAITDKRVADVIGAVMSATAGRPNQSALSRIAAFADDFSSAILPPRFAYMLAAATLLGVVYGGLSGQSATSSNNDAAVGSDTDQYLPIGPR